MKQKAAGALIRSLKTEMDHLGIPEGIVADMMKEKAASTAAAAAAAAVPAATAAAPAAAPAARDHWEDLEAGGEDSASLGETLCLPDAPEPVGWGGGVMGWHLLHLLLKMLLMCVHVCVVVRGVRGL